MRHLVIRSPDDRSTPLLPEWMTFSRARTMKIVTTPRLPIRRLVELRDLIDRLVLSSGAYAPGRKNNEINSAAPTEPVHDTVTVVAHTSGTSTNESTGSAKNIAKRGDVRIRTGKHTLRSGGQR
jgi:hypothetical protein